jgi:hypothetical protein
MKGAMLMKWKRERKAPIEAVPGADREYEVGNGYQSWEDEFVGQALDDLQKYVEGKYSIDHKATENQEWWRLRHLDISPDAEDKHTRSASAWAVNSILNKHADIMDSFPKPNILPREADDEEEAKSLSAIVPVALEQNDYEQVFRDMAWDFAIDGGAITGVFWDSNKYDGLGDISITNVDVHNLFWKPGVSDIQKSPKIYHVSLEEVEAVRAMYPDIAEQIGPQDSGKITKYLHDDNIDTSNCVEVINMYYKTHVRMASDTGARDEEGNPLLIESVKTVLHLAIIVGDRLAFCSERTKGYENGFYEHGQYPFVIRRAFPIKDTPWGFGYLDIMKNPQMYIDAMDDDIIKIADMKARPRFWVRKNGNIDKDQFADWSEPFVEVATGELGDAVRQIDVYDVPAGIMEHRANKIDELKETSGNRDFSQGSTQSGVTAASAIAALQEAGSKLSRDMNKELYRGAREEYYLVIELIRQFYTEPRGFRVNGDMGGSEFIEYSNEGLQADAVLPDGSIRHRRPIFDISVSAEKQSPFSRAAQNEMIKELYGMGLFDPNNDLPALTCIDAMDFEGKDKLKQQIQQNGVMMRQFQSAMQLIMRMAQVDPMVAQMAAEQGLIDPMMVQQMQQAQAQEGTAEQRAAKNGTAKGDNSLAAQARTRVAHAAEPR